MYRNFGTLRAFVSIGSPGAHKSEKDPCMSTQFMTSMPIELGSMMHLSTTRERGDSSKSSSLHSWILKCSTTLRQAHLLQSLVLSCEDTRTSARRLVLTPQSRPSLCFTKSVPLVASISHIVPKVVSCTSCIIANRRSPSGKPRATTLPCLSQQLALRSWSELCCELQSPSRLVVVALVVAQLGPG